jgi:hypothetical protein
MNGHSLLSDAIKRQYADQILKGNTFKPQGISEKAALTYLDTDDGAIYWSQVAEGFPPDTDSKFITERAVNQLKSGLELPRMETIGTDEVLVKFVAEGFEPSGFSPYWARESAGNAAVEAGKNISQFYGLPISSEAPRYGMYRITPRFPTQVFITTVAPTSELDGLVTKSGGAEQALVPNRQLFNDPVLVRLVDNTPSIATDVERGVSRNAVRGLTALGAAAVVYDATTTASRTADLRSHSNHVGAESEVMHFGGRNLGALGGAVLGAQVLGTAGIESGPMDVLVAGAGAIGGAIGGEKLVEAYDRHRIYQQTDPQNVAWTYDPARPQQGWTRQVPTAETSNPPTSLLGYGALPVPVMRTIRADPALADRLSFQASSVAVELALAHPPRPRDPYSQPASPQDAPSHVAAPWKRDAQTQQWSRVVTDRMLEHGMAATHIEHASAARAAQLDAAARQTIEANQAGSRRGIAERYRAAYDQRGWAQYGDLPKAVSHALHEPPDTRRASDGHSYTRSTDGQWNTPGLIRGTNAAEGNLRRELDATRRVAQREREPAQASDGMQALRPFSHPDHPQHALFNKLHDMFPAGTSNERLHQATAACYKAGIRQPAHLSAMGTSDGAIHFGSTQLGGGYGRMDITNPPPTIAQTMQDVQQYDRQQVQWMGQMQAQQAQRCQQAPQGPMPGG